MARSQDLVCVSVDPGFWSGGAQWSFDPRGALSPKFAKKSGFLLKLLENCMTLKKILGARARLDPLVRIHTYVYMCSDKQGERQKCLYLQAG